MDVYRNHDGTANRSPDSDTEGEVSVLPEGSLTLLHQTFPSGNNLPFNAV